MAVIKYPIKATFGKTTLFFGLPSEVKSNMEKTEQQEPFVVRKKRYMNAHTQISFSLRRKSRIPATKIVLPTVTLICGFQCSEEMP